MRMMVGRVRVMVRMRVHVVREIGNGEGEMGDDAGDPLTKNGYGGEDTVSQEQVFLDLGQHSKHTANMDPAMKAPCSCQTGRTFLESMVATDKTNRSMSLTVGMQALFEQFKIL